MTNNEIATNKLAAQSQGSNSCQQQFSFAVLALFQQLLESRDNCIELMGSDHDSLASYRLKLHHKTVSHLHISPYDALVSSINIVHQIQIDARQIADSFVHPIDDLKHEAQKLLFHSPVRKLFNSYERNEGLPEIDTHPEALLSAWQKDFRLFCAKLIPVCSAFNERVQTFLSNFSNPFRLTQDSQTNSSLPLSADHTREITGQHLNQALAFFLYVGQSVTKETLSLSQEQIEALRNAAKTLPTLASTLATIHQTINTIEQQCVNYNRCIDSTAYLEQLRRWCETQFRNEVKRVLSLPDDQWIVCDNNGGRIASGDYSVIKPRVALPPCNCYDSVRDDVKVLLRIEQVQSTSLEAAIADAHERLNQNIRESEAEEQRQKELCIEAVRDARLGHLSTAVAKSTGLLINELQATLEKVVRREQKRLTTFEKRIKAANDIYLEHQEIAKNTMLGSLMSFLRSEVADETALRSHLTEASHLVAESKWVRRSEAMKAVRSWLPVAEEMCQYCAILLRWSPDRTEPDLIEGLSPRKLDPDRVFVNALCSISAVDGVFCTKEKGAIFNILSRLNILDERTMKLYVNEWLKDVQENGVTKMIAQSVRDTMTVKGTLYGDALPRAMQLVSKADGEIDDRESKVINMVLNLLK